MKGLHFVKMDLCLAATKNTWKSVQQVLTHTPLGGGGGEGVVTLARL